MILETDKKCGGASGFGATGQKIISVHGGEKFRQFYHNCVEWLPKQKIGLVFPGNKDIKQLIQQVHYGLYCAFSGKKTLIENHYIEYLIQ